MTTMHEAPDDEFLLAALRFWHPVARSRDLDGGSVVPVVLLGRRLALWRAHDGSLGLVDDLCAHRGTRLSKGIVADGCIQCPYHAWRFDLSGRCQLIPQLPHDRIPTRADVNAHRTLERDGLVWACLVDAAHEARGVPRLVPEAENQHTYAGEPMEWRCQATRQIENFVDLAHFSVLHVDAFGNPDELGVEPYEVRRSSDGAALTFYTEYPALNPLEAPGPDGRRPVHPTPFDYRVELPFASTLVSAIDGHPYVLAVAARPVSATETVVYWVFSIDAALGLDDGIIEAMERAVFEVDRGVVETQRPEALPLDLTAELHLPFDRFAVAYRRALAGLGFPLSSAYTSGSIS
jgi:vanillate O-demethylase monooxygenase subunit